MGEEFFLKGSKDRERKEPSLLLFSEKSCEKPHQD